MHITCCEVAITLALTNILSLAIFAGYTVKIRQNQVELLKKNGAEQKQLDELRAGLEKANNSLSSFNKERQELKKEIEKLKTRGSKN